MRMMAVFEKGALLRHLGHLDLMRAMQRALRRSDLPISYSGGFSPHIKLSFPSPLPVGVTGLHEIMDVPVSGAVTPEAFKERLNASLPKSLRIKMCRALDDSFPTLMALVAGSDYAITLPEESAESLSEAVSAFMKSEVVMALRKTKSGENMCNIRPFVLCARVENGVLRCVTEQNESGALKPALLAQTLCELAGVDAQGFAYTRENILCRDRVGALMPLQACGLPGDADA